MSQHDRILEALCGNQGIEILPSYWGSPEDYVHRKPDWDPYNPAQFIAYYIYPKGGVYDVDGLQSLMLSLIPDEKPSKVRPFAIIENRSMQLGFLEFEETIATRFVCERYNVTDSHLASTTQFSGGQREFERDERLYRLVRVCVAPNAVIAQGMWDGDCPEHVSLESLEETRKKLLGIPPDTPTSRPSGIISRVKSFFFGK